MTGMEPNETEKAEKTTKAEEKTPRQKSAFTKLAVDTKKKTREKVQFYRANRSGSKVLISKDKLAVAKANQAVDKRLVREKADDRAARLRPHRERFEQARQQKATFADSSYNHSDEIDDFGTAAFQKVIDDVPVEDVDFGVNPEKDPKEILFRVQAGIPHWVIIGSLRDRLRVFHIGPSGNGQFESC